MLCGIPDDTGLRSAGVNGSAFRQNGTNYLGYGSYACRAPTLKYLPSALPQISLVSGQAVTKPLLISNGFGDSSWGGNASASSSGVLPLLWHRPAVDVLQETYKSQVKTGVGIQRHSASLPHPQSESVNLEPLSMRGPGAR